MKISVGSFRVASAPREIYFGRSEHISKGLDKLAQGTPLFQTPNRMNTGLEDKVHSLLRHAKEGESALAALRGLRFVKELGRGGWGLSTCCSTRTTKKHMP
jgi:hypothetical protein